MYRVRLDNKEVSQGQPRGPMISLANRGIEVPWSLDIHEDPNFSWELAVFAESWEYGQRSPHVDCFQSFLIKVA